MKKLIFLPILLALSIIGFTQDNKPDIGQIHGNFESINQYYNPDTAIGALPVPEKLLSNSFLNLNYVKGKFSAGVRFESYLNVLQGFDPGYEGTGFPYKYASYKMEKLEVTVGNFYEQFGSGMIFRSYEARQLGIDNAMEGVRLKFNPYKGVYMKGLIGQQRLFFGKGAGIVRGIDTEVNLNEAITPLAEAKTIVTLGGSFVSKYQQDNDPLYNLPENVAAGSLRLNLFRSGFSLSGEYAYKANDPSSTNGLIYKPGVGALVSAGYSKKGFGVTFSGKVIDNMDFRSDRTATLNDLTVGFLPATTKQHTYNLAATLYPYGTQPNGEVAFQADVLYKIKKKTKLGGKYGTLIALNYSRVNSLHKTYFADIGETDSSRIGYKTDYTKLGEQLYFEDFNIDITRKINKKLKLKAAFFSFIYDMEVIQGLGGAPTVYATVEVLDVLYKITPKHAIRVEAQHLGTKQDQGSWVTGLAEYTFSPHWFIAVMDQYNYGNELDYKRLHYVTGSVGYNNGGNRFSLSYGRQRAGIFCVGGVCRNVPAANGFTLSITSSF